MSEALVSILIRSTDRPTLMRTLDSVAAQTYRNIEIVVVAASGISHRGLPSDLGGLPLRLVRHPSGAALSRPDAANTAIEAMRGEWFNFLDDDDEFLPAHVETLLGATGTAAQRVRYSRTQVRATDGSITGHSGRAGFHAQLYFQARGTFIATMFHHSLIEQGARFDPAFLSYQDRDFMVNCATRTAFGFVDAVTCVWHAHAGGSGTGHGDNQQTEVQQRFLPMLREKWAPHFNRWLSEPQAQLFIGQQMLRDERPQEALVHLEQALKMAPNDVNALNLTGMAYFQAGNLPRAEELVGAAVARLPTHEALRENLKLIQDARRAS